MIRWLVAPLLFCIGVASSSEAATAWIQSYTGTGYVEFRVLSPRSFVYSDRQYVFGEVPDCLMQSEYLVTANNAKFSTQPNLFDIAAGAPVFVYVGYDTRYLPDRPNWLIPFHPTGMWMTVIDPVNNQIVLTFEVFKLPNRTSQVILGGNLRPDERRNFGMYTAVLVVADHDECD